MKIAIILILLVFVHNLRADDRGEEKETDLKCTRIITGEVFNKQNIIAASIAASELNQKSEIKFIVDKIKCSYLIKKIFFINRIVPDRKIYSHICPKLNGKFKLIAKTGGILGESDDPPQSREDGTRIYLVKSSLGYIWQKGECDTVSQALFLSLENKNFISIKKLEKNKFMMLEESTDNKLYYANPGYVIRIKKENKSCLTAKKCKKDEFEIVFKTHLKAAVLDNNGKLYTDEKLE